MVPIDFAGAAYDFGKNYYAMRKVNIIGADKYFHSKANFLATRRGPGGAFFAIHFSNLREIIDQRIKGDEMPAVLEDQKANIYGRKKGWNYRYYKGPINYNEVIPKYRINDIPKGY